jgi:hypothetical protein
MFATKHCIYTTWGTLAPMSSDVPRPEEPRKQISARLRLSSLGALVRIAAAETLATGQKVTQQDLLDRAIELLTIEMDAKHPGLIKRDEPGQGA